ncbi:DEAD/DEAH box helicase family protein [Luteolibacter pohnpeiensis]|uniref:DEAD/DEAH box helicase family protein n=1 Tax=Luteolibacter pohnpeiensis TaxID=454153 RepID=A0A934SCB5_9BACT|nr:type I restriction endonuclease subunit R [Luteolibacter pohnpeiensis]MBK1883542.1 DEAD/DEAH box helicase family protein [Luteolibacter pohnpeiensis]
MSAPEFVARKHIDTQLSAAGWIVQSVNELNLAAGKGIAIRELRSEGGPADYVLFVDGKAIGVVEAKKTGETLSHVADQSARYTAAKNWIPQRWTDPLPFTYETTGVETNFRDQRDPDSRSRPVFAFHRPEHLLELVQQPDSLRTRLAALPSAHPLVTEPLRDCQISAITGLETSLAGNRPRALLQMATGSGKTFTAVTQAYRLIKHAGAKRILFLVDRGNLGRQTVNEFQQFTTPDDGRKFTDLYNVQMLGPAGIDPVCQVTVSTIQRLYSQLTNNPLDDEADEHSGYELDGTGGPSREPLPVSYNPAIPIETFDFIIVDECHRSIYNLWRQVLDYFDAFLIGLTATPSKATLGFFNRNLVTEYPHVQAVADGVNVGYDIYRIKTRISEGGTKLDAGFDYQKRDRLTREKRWAVQDEDETVAKTQLDRSVVVPDQIRTVIRAFREKLFTDLFPDRPARAESLGLDVPWVPKTLIFAKDDNHAEDIVTHVREEFGKGNDFCKKVTYKAGAKPEEIIKAFRTAPEFRIAVTVDMIATGTDIKPLECLLFLRDVRSQLYFEQMKGRGTRTIDPTDLATVTPDAGSKSRFVLVDAVGVTESDKTDSRPLERKPTVPFDKLLQQVALGVRDEDTLTSLANRLARLDQSLSDSDKAELQTLGGISLKQLTSNLLQATDPDHALDQFRAQHGPDSEPTESELGDLRALAVKTATEPLATNPAYRALLETKRRDREVTIDHLSGDEVLATGYDEEKARGLIENWKQFLVVNQDEITALQILYNRPNAKRHLVYEELKTLAEAVARPPYHIAPAEVWKAYEHLEKRKPTADPAKVLTNLITLVRHTVDPEHQPLAPFPELVEARYQQWLDQQGERFTDAQRHWLDIIKNTIALNGAFPTDEQEDYLEAWQNVDSKEGVPLAVARKAFGNEDPKPIIEELNEILVA